MSSETSDSYLLDQLCEEFAQRYRRGERPAVEDYAAEYPRLAEQIRAVFPTLQVIEEFGASGKGAAEQPGAATFDDRVVPRQLGEYRIVREIGRGGMGVVYEAVQETLGRHVALKVLPPHPSLTAVQLERFGREARTAAQLHHTNIVPVFGVGSQDGVHYYAMQFIDGEGLDKVIAELRHAEKPGAGASAGPGSATSKRGAWSLLWGGSGGIGPSAGSEGEVATEALSLAAVNTPSCGPTLDFPAPLPPAIPDVVQSTAGSVSRFSGQASTHYVRKVAQIGQQVAEALGYAHQHGVLHRDIKPSNLLLDVDGRVWIADFGLVKVEGSDGVTSGGEAVGTLSYMPPERFEGTSRRQSDIYSLGATLYELLTLRPPFADANRLRQVERIRSEEPRWPAGMRRQVPRDLRTIVTKALEKEPQRRYDSAEEMAEDLRRFLADEPIRARRTSAVERAWRSCRRNPGVASLSAAVILLLATIAVVSSLMAARLQEANKQSKKQDDFGKEAEEFTLPLRGPAAERSGDEGAVAAAPEVVLRFGIRASETPWEVYHDVRPILQPLIADLEAALQRPVVVKIRVFRDYYRVIEAVANGEVDFWRCGPDAYVLAKMKNAKIRLLARHGDLDYSLIIARKALGVETLGDLKKLVEEKKAEDKKLTVALGDSVSGSGRFRILAALASVCIYADDVEWEYLGRHDEVAKAVGSGAFDLGGLKGPVYEKFFGEEGDFHDTVNSISYGAEEVFTGPGKPWVARAGLDQHLFNVLQKCLYRLTETRYQEFWRTYEVDEELQYREKPPEDWGLPIVPARDADYARTRQIQEDSWGFFQELTDRLIAVIRKDPSPADRVEMTPRVQQALSKLDLLGRDILILRHFKQLGFAEIAEVLGIDASEARERYHRALEQIKKAAASPSDGFPKPFHCSWSPASRRLLGRVPAEAGTTNSCLDNDATRNMVSGDGACPLSSANLAMSYSLTASAAQISAITSDSLLRFTKRSVSAKCA